MPSAPQSVSVPPPRPSAPVSSPPVRPPRPSRLRPGGGTGAGRDLRAAGPRPEPDPRGAVLLFFTTGAVSPWRGEPVRPAG